MRPSSNRRRLFYLASVASHLPTRRRPLDRTHSGTWMRAGPAPQFREAFFEEPGRPEARGDGEWVGGQHRPEDRGDAEQPDPAVECRPPDHAPDVAGEHESVRAKLRR